MHHRVLARINPLGINTRNQSLVLSSACCSSLWRCCWGRQLLSAVAAASAAPAPDCCFLLINFLPPSVLLVACSREKKYGRWCGCARLQRTSNAKPKTIQPLYEFGTDPCRQVLDILATGTQTNLDLESRKISYPIRARLSTWRWASRTDSEVLGTSTGIFPSEFLSIKREKRETNKKAKSRNRKI